MCISSFQGQTSAVLCIEKGVYPIVRTAAHHGIATSILLSEPDRSERGEQGDDREESLEFHYRLHVCLSVRGGCRAVE